MPGNGTTCGHVILTFAPPTMAAASPAMERVHANTGALPEGATPTRTNPFPCVLLVVISHLIEWAKERWVRSPLLRKWYLQPFNIAKYVIAGGVAYGACHALDAGRTSLGAPSAMVAIAAAAVTFVALNKILLGLALVLARGLSWHATGVLDAENLQTELILVCLGAVVAALWHLNPGLILPALTPLVLMYRALMIPQLKHEAQIDGKTGVSNARHFGTLFTAEFERARRFNRPLAFIMADLDLLRDINNTYGHLAGDAVLRGIGQVIRTAIRDYDVAGRFGGEEFALVLPEAGPLEAQVVAERLRQAVEATRFKVATSAQPMQVTMSLGVACFPADATTPTDLTHAADLAVYQAKAGGRNRVVCAADVLRSLTPDHRPGAERIAPPRAAAPRLPADPATGRTASPGDVAARSVLTDDLTGLSNHRAFQEELQRALIRAHQRGEALALARLDLDEFKVLNDAQGHV